MKRNHKLFITVNCKRMVIYILEIVVRKIKLLGVSETLLISISSKCK